VPTFEFGETGPRILVTAGLHGWETTAIAVAWELTGRLAELATIGAVRARICVMPICNPLGTLAMSRVEPETGLDLNRLFPADGRVPPHSALDRVARRIAEADVYVDLHSAGEAAYWPHVLVADRARLGDACAFGLRCVLWRNGAAGATGTSLRYAQVHGARAFCLEIGGGTQVEAEMVRSGVDAILRFLARQGLAGDEPTVWAETSIVYPCDPRRIVKSREDGIFYALHGVGDDVEREGVIGYRIRSGTWEREPIVAGEQGFIIYLRNESRVHPLDTLVMILPPREGVDEGEEPRTVLA